MKKIVLSTFVVASFLLYSYGVRNGEPVSSEVKSVPSGPGASGSGNTSSTGSGNGASDSSPAASQYKDGTYTGPVTDAIYGDFQVQAVINGGKIADIRFLQYPDDHTNSVSINRQAMPLLKQEAIQAQSAQVDGVSGATETSVAFIQSLEAALRQAAM